MNPSHSEIEFSKGLTPPQRQELVLQNIPGICALVHQIQLGDHSNGAKTCTRRTHQNKAMVYTTQHAPYYISQPNTTMAICTHQLQTHSPFTLSHGYFSVLLSQIVEYSSFP